MMSKKSFTIFLAMALAAFASGFALYKHFSSEINKVSIKQATEELHNYAFSEHNTLSFDCTPHNTEIDKLYEIEITPYSEQLTEDDNGRKKTLELCERFLGKNVDADGFNDTNMYTYYDGEEVAGEYFNVGTFWVRDKRVPDDFGDELSIVKSIKASDDYSNEQYKVGGEIYSISDAVNFSEKVIDEYKDYLHSDETLKLTDIAVISGGGFDEYNYILHYTHMIDGVAVSDNGFFDIDTDEFMKPAYFEIHLMGKDKVFQIRNNYYYEIRNKNSVDKIIPLSSAEKLMADSIAQNLHYNVTECELKYVCITNYTDEKAYYKPMWAFTIDEYGENGADYFCERCGYVDAQTGDVYLCDAKEHLLTKQ